MKKIVLFIVLSFSVFVLNAQTTVKGVVYDEYLEPFPGAIIRTPDNIVATSKFDGTFTIEVSSLPTSLIVSSVGYAKETIEVKNTNDLVNVILKETNILDEVVVSASRTPERILESPVTIERIGIKDIKKNSSVNFYDGLENLKGVDLNTNSLIYKSVNARGFASLENVRFVQLIDGVDNALPGRNVFAGNLAGINELDVQSVEVLPGASSALYGANALNGIMNITSKNPFNHQGISVLMKGGMTSQDAGGNNPFFNTAVRFAHVFDNKFATKVNFSYFKGEEWHATNHANTTGIGGVIIPGDKNLPSYDGLNVYGDEVSTNMFPVAQGLLNAGLLPINQTQLNALAPQLNQVVNRTGYEELYLMSNKAKNVKTDVLLNYRPKGDDSLEVTWNSRFNLGDNISQASANRYEQKEGYLEQHELKFKGSNFLVRGYYSKTKSGDSYDTRLAAIGINRAWKSDPEWFGQYVGAYLQALPLGNDRAHEIARQTADTGRALPGTQAFNNIFNEVLTRDIKDGGGFFVDNSSLYHFDGNLNLKDYIDWAEIQVGGSYRINLLESGGNVYTDYNGAIRYDDYGIYTQLRKKMLDDRLKLTASIRYDKTENIDKGNFSPRLALTYAAGENKNHNFRASYQTAFRNPTAQDQYVGITTGNKDYRLGSIQDNLDRFVGTIGGTTFTGNQVFNNLFSLSSVQAFGAAATAGATNPQLLLQKANFNLVKPETLNTFEVGYRGTFDFFGTIFEIDANTYYNKFNDVLTEKVGIYPLNGLAINASDISTPEQLAGFTSAIGDLQNENFAAIAVQTNSNVDVESYGGSVGVYTKLFSNYDLGVSYTYSDYTFDQSQDLDFKLRFNTPKNKVKVQFGNNNLFKNFGFNINARWQDSFLWQSAFLDGVIEERTVVDAQLNYRVPSLKSRFKLGGTNLTGKEYYGAMGSGLIGSMYYLSWTIND